MKNYIAISILALATAAGAAMAQDTAPAPEPAAPAAAPAVAPEETVIPAVEPAAEPAADVESEPVAPVAPAESAEKKFVAVDPSDLMQKVLAAYSGADSFTMEFTVVQAPIRGKINEEHIDKYVERYLLYYLDSDPGDSEYMLRLEALEGYNRRTTVVYAPDKSGNYVYKVYKPALPNGSVLAKDNILLDDIPETIPSVFLKKLDDLVRGGTPDDVSATFYPSTNKYIMQIFTQMEFNRKEKKHRITVQISGADFRMISEDIHVRPKDGKEEYDLVSRVQWFAYEPGADIAHDTITQVPNFNKE